MCQDITFKPVGSSYLKQWPKSKQKEYSMLEFSVCKLLVLVLNSKRLAKIHLIYML